MIKTKAAVHKAIIEFDSVGRETFLKKYGFGKARSYMLVHEGKRYDSKAIIGVAYGYETPSAGPLSPADFSGGASSVKVWLEALGFTVDTDNSVEPKEATQPASKLMPLPPAISDRSKVNNPYDDRPSVDDACATLHDLVNCLPRLSFPIDFSLIPDNGIYILFERGESGHNADRIVRVGTHTGDGQLPSRIKQHFLSKNKDRSIFRKNVGRCFLNRDDDPFLAEWEIDLTTRSAKEEHAVRIDRCKQEVVEHQVSDYLQAAFSFVVFSVPLQESRLFIESRMISTVSLCSCCSPSNAWLGNHSPKSKIRRSGLWQVNELFKTPMSQSEVRVVSDVLNPLSK